MGVGCHRTAARWRQVREREIEIGTERTYVRACDLCGLQHVRAAVAHCFSFFIVFMNLQKQRQYIFYLNKIVQPNALSQYNYVVREQAPTATACWLARRRFEHVVFSFCTARERAYKSESNMLQPAQNLNSVSFSKLSLPQYELLMPPHSIVAIHKNSDCMSRMNCDLTNTRAQWNQSCLLRL